MAAQWPADGLPDDPRWLVRVASRRLVDVHRMQAAIAAVHAEAVEYPDTDWMQVTMLYRGTLQAPAPITCQPHGW